MLTFWKSTEKLSVEALEVQWLGVGLTLVGLLVPDMRWLPWLGVLTTAAGIALRHRAEFLRRVQATPRTISTEQAGVITARLKDVPKCAMAVGFLGTDLEAKQYATQIAAALSSAGFEITQVEGFVAFELQRALEVTAFNSDSNNPSALGLRDAFVAAGLETRFVTNPNRCELAVGLNVHAKGIS